MVNSRKDADGIRVVVIQDSSAETNEKMGCLRPQNDLEEIVYIFMSHLAGISLIALCVKQTLYHEIGWCVYAWL